VAALARVRLPDLRIVPTAALCLHEECDPERVARLAGRLAAEGVLRNPPVVAPLGDDAYVVLDGANRVTALQTSGVPHQVVQVVDYDDPDVRLEVWAHLLPEDAGAARAAGAWEALPVHEMYAGLAAGRVACGLVTRTGAFGVPGGPDLAARVRVMAAVVAAYKGRQTIYRVQPADLEALAREYDRADALVVFPRLSKADIRALARLPQKLPTGISRHVLPLRALRVNADLALLRGPEPAAVKQARLDEAIRARLLEHRVRHYPEPTVLYDE
jgi:ParB-like chromosome segregation protein Spo0J